MATELFFSQIFHSRCKKHRAKQHLQKPSLQYSLPYPAKMWVVANVKVQHFDIPVAASYGWDRHYKCDLSLILINQMKQSKNVFCKKYPVIGKEI